jgi:hypothetical protein
MEVFIMALGLGVVVIISAYATSGKDDATAKTPKTVKTA